METLQKGDQAPVSPIPFATDNFFKSPFFRATALLANNSWAIDPRMMERMWTGKQAVGPSVM